VLAYNLSKNPWSQVLTLYLRTCSTVANNPSFPFPSPGRLNSINFTNFSGLWCSTRLVLGPPPGTARPWPVCLVAASSSADLMNGIIKDWTALSNYRELGIWERRCSVAGGTAWEVAHIINFIGSFEGFGLAAVLERQTCLI